MMIPYSTLRSLPVCDRRGATIGWVADVVVHPDGDDVVVDRVLVAPTLVRFALTRLSLSRNTFTVRAADIASVDEGGIRLRSGDG